VLSAGLPDPSFQALRSPLSPHPAPRRHTQTQITFFGENLPQRFVQCVKSDFPRCEVCLIFGTSLMVQPFASLVQFVPRGVPRLLVNRERRGEELGLDFDSAESTDGLFLGDCDAGAKMLSALLGWTLPVAAATAAGNATLGGSATGMVAPGIVKVRLGLTRSGTAKLPECVVLVEPNYEAITRAAVGKLKLAARSSKRLVLRSSSRGHAIGTVLPTAGDCSHYLCHDALIWVEC